MTTEPGAHNQPFEAPATAPSTGHEQGQPGATPAALQVQILATEHWSLLATRSQTWNESFARALVAEASSFGSGFTTFALILLPVVLFLGLTSYIRLVAINHDETRWVLGMNRIRAAYLELAPELERWFITSHHDDEKGAAATAGVITFLATRALGLQAPAAAALGVLIAVVLNLALTAYSRWAYRRWRDLYPLSVRPPRASADGATCRRRRRTEPPTPTAKQDQL